MEGRRQCTFPVVCAPRAGARRYLLHNETRVENLYYFRVEFELCSQMTCVDYHRRLILKVEWDTYPLPILHHPHAHRLTALACYRRTARFRPAHAIGSRAISLSAQVSYYAQGAAQRQSQPVHRAGLVVDSAGSFFAFLSRFSSLYDESKYSKPDRKQVQ